MSAYSAWVVELTACGCGRQSIRCGMKLLSALIGVYGVVELGIKARIMR